MTLINEDKGEIIVPQPAAKSKEQNITTTTMIAPTEKVILQTAIATLENPCTHEQITSRILFDSGSQRSYISKEMMQKLSLKRISSDKLSVQTFASKERKKLKAPLVEINLLCEKEEKISL